MQYDVQKYLYLVLVHRVLVCTLFIGMLVTFAFCFGLVSTHITVPCMKNRSNGKNMKKKCDIRTVIKILHALSILPESRNKNEPHRWFWVSMERAVDTASFKLPSLRYKYDDTNIIHSASTLQIRIVLRVEEEGKQRKKCNNHTHTTNPSSAYFVEYWVLLSVQYHHSDSTEARVLLIRSQASGVLRIQTVDCGQQSHFWIGLLYSSNTMKFEGCW